MMQPIRCAGLGCAAIRPSMVWLLSIAAFLMMGAQLAASDLEAAREAMSAREWRRAAALLTDHLEQDADDLEAFYLRGICYGEIGKNPNFRNRLERTLEKGAADFEAVLARDSLYRDAVFQYALLRRYQDDFQEAIRLAEAQIRLQPDLPHAHIGLLNFYWRYVVTTPPAEARLWLRTRPGLYAALFVGKTFEQQSLFRPAQQLYLNLEEEGQEGVPVLVALARLHFAWQEPISGTRYMKRAIDAISTELDALLLMDEIRTIVTPGEQAAFERLTTAEESRQFFSEFWEKRDPMSAAPYNARLVEHYRRLRIAETHYVFNGFRNWFRSRYTHEERYFPPTYALGHDFDDRGIMFIRHGEPDDFTVSDSPTWLYEESAENHDSLLVFHFAPTCHNSICGVTKHFVPTPHGDSFLPPRLTGLDRLDAERKTQTYITQGLSTDRHRWPAGTKQLEVPYQLASFRGLDGRTLVEAYFDVPLEDLVTGRDTLTFESGFAVHDDQWIRHVLSRNTTRLPSVRADEPYIGLFQSDLRPQPYRVSLHVRSLDVQALRAYLVSYEPLSFTGPGLNLSDVLLADSVVLFTDGEIAEREDVHLQVNPSGHFEAGASPTVYFEVYNLALSTAGRTRYTISYSLADPRGDVISLAPSELEGTLRSPIEYVIIDVADVPSGAYTLTVTVHDQLADATVSRSRQLSIGR